MSCNRDPECVRSRQQRQVNFDGMAMPDRMALHHPPRRVVLPLTPPRAKLLRVPKQSQSDVEEMARELMLHFDALTREFLLPQKSAQLSRSEAALLQFLADREASNMSAVSSGLGLALSSSTGLVDRLVERGLVARSRPPDDRRRVTVALTARGHRSAEALQKDRIRLGVGMLQRLSARERQALLGLFRKVTGQKV
jgi:MarR family transcriptional regulator, lower aerobic nicotinate degradation pathway regulator